MVKKHITTIGVLSLGKIIGIIYAVIGLIFGAIITAASLMIGSAMAAWGFEGDMFGTGAIIVLPVFYGIMGLIMGIVVALVYNLVARSIGGLELDVE